MSKIFIEKFIIKNRAPFENLELNFKENEIAVLTAVNGRGKTTVLSHITDAWYEIAKKSFPKEYEGKSNKFYRISSRVYSIAPLESSFVYIRFNINGEIVDYVDIVNMCTKEQYDKAIQLKDKILFSELSQSLEENNCVKHVMIGFDKKRAEDVFKTNVMTYFPSYRYEQPGYLNDPYEIDMKFSKKMPFAGYQRNPIEVVSGLQQLANWMMDVVLDWELVKSSDARMTTEARLWISLNKIITQTLSSKSQKELLFAIGKRNLGSTRIAIVQQEDEDVVVAPTIFDLSSGELSVFCMFGEILRQADRNRSHAQLSEVTLPPYLIVNDQLSEITGIVLIDEVDKHLHIKLQKEVLPELFNLFPNVQFILSSHSPFLNMGLAESNRTKVRAKIIDLDRNGLVISPQENELYKEVYEMMIKENENYAKSHKELLSTKKPILFVEDTYTQIYKVAWLKLNEIEFNQADLENKFDDAPFCIFGKGNNSNLQGFLDNPCMDEWKDKIIAGLFDFDDAYKNYQSLKQKWEEISDNDKIGLYKKRSDYEVYALMLPIPEHRKKIAGKDQQVKQLEVELLLSDEKIEEIFGGSDYATDKIIDDIYIPKIKNKSDFWKKTLKLQSDDFAAFRPLFSTLSIIFNLNK